MPLHDRLPQFLDRLRRTWLAINPAGRLWWEPWELSAAQVTACVERLEPQGFGLSLHANIAECMSTVAADPWFVRTARQAQLRGIPVWAEWFLGGVCEETEPIQHLAHPVTVWRGLRRILATAGVTGLKEYYGLLPDRFDSDFNLQATVLFLEQPNLSEDEMLAHLTAPYQAAAGTVAEALRLASEGMEFYPWDCSWYGREIGRSMTDHSLNAAILRPMLCPTPSWESTRGTIFMRTEATPAHPWMLEDVGLRCAQASAIWNQALAAISKALPLVDGTQREILTRWHDSLSALRRRARAYALHLRATMIATAARIRIKDCISLTPSMTEEMREVLQASRTNHAEECRATGAADNWEEMDAAIRDLGDDLTDWLKRWLQPAEDQRSKGMFSLTSV